MGRRVKPNAPERGHNFLNLFKIMIGFKFYINLRNGETHTVRALTKEQAIEFFVRAKPYNSNEIWYVSGGKE